MTNAINIAIDYFKKQAERNAKVAESFKLESIKLQSVLETMIKDPNVEACRYFEEYNKSHANLDSIVTSWQSFTMPDWSKIVPGLFNAEIPFFDKESSMSEDRETLASLSNYADGLRDSIVSLGGIMSSFIDNIRGLSEIERLNIQEIKVLYSEVARLRQANDYLFKLISLEFSGSGMCVVTPPEGVPPSDGNPVTFQGDWYYLPRQADSLPQDTSGMMFTSYHPDGLKGSTEYPCAMKMFGGGMLVLAPPLLQS